MVVLKFKNESGDPEYIICEVDIILTEKEIENIVKENIGDDYCDGYICGEYWVESVDSNIPKASSLLK